MQRKGSNQRLSSSSSNNTLLRSRISFLMLTMLATIASFYVAGRLWQDAQNRVYIINELDKITGQGRSAISVDDSLKVIACREQQKKLSALQMELAAAKEEGFVPKHYGIDKDKPKKRPLVIIGILTSFGRKNKRDAVRKAWMGTGAALKKMENENGIVARFVIGRSENRGDSLDLEIDIENRQNNDFIILNDHVETSAQLPKKTMYFFAYASNWEAEFYAKVNDDVYVNVDALGNTLAAHVDKPRVYMGCMKSGEVFSEPNQKWYEPEWWKFGDGKSYFRHASGEIFVISHALAKFVSINRSKLRTYAHDDVSVGSWFIGLDIKHIDENHLSSALTHMMMSVLVPGLLGSISNTLTKKDFAVRRGLQELFVQEFVEDFLFFSTDWNLMKTATDFFCMSKSFFCVQEPCLDPGPYKIHQISYLPSVHCTLY